MSGEFRENNQFGYTEAAFPVAIPLDGLGIHFFRNKIPAYTEAFILDYDKPGEDGNIHSGAYLAIRDNEGPEEIIAANSYGIDYATRAAKTYLSEVGLGSSIELAGIHCMENGFNYRFKHVDEDYSFVTVYHDGSVGVSRLSKLPMRNPFA